MTKRRHPHVVRSRSWVVDTNLVVDWCLWHVDENGPPGVSERAAQRRTKLTLPDHRDGLEAVLLSAREVFVSQPTIVEIGLTLRRILASHHGISDQLSPPLIEAALAFFERFKVASLGIARASLQREVVTDFGVGDAVLVACIADRSLLTADRDLWLWCRDRDLDVAFFTDGGLREE